MGHTPSLLAVALNRLPKQIMWQWQVRSSSQGCRVNSGCHKQVLQPCVWLRTGVRRVLEALPGRNHRSASGCHLDCQRLWWHAAAGRTKHHPAASVPGCCDCKSVPTTTVYFVNKIHVSVCMQHLHTTLGAVCDCHQQRGANRPRVLQKNWRNLLKGAAVGPTV